MRLTSSAAFDLEALHVGDPTFAGWLTTAAYFSTATMCVLCALRLDRHAGARERLRVRLVWWSLAVLVLFLGANKQLDLQTLFTAVGREIAKGAGWYAYRRTVQAWFVAALATVSLAALVAAGWALRREWRRRRLALIGLAILVGFVLVRAASFHHLGAALDWELEGPAFQTVPELLGIACIAISAANALFHEARG
jgi:MFS family permease